MEAQLCVERQVVVLAVGVVVEVVGVVEAVVVGVGAVEQVVVGVQVEVVEETVDKADAEVEAVVHLLRESLTDLARKPGGNLELLAQLKSLFGRMNEVYGNIYIYCNNYNIFRIVVLILIGNSYIYSIKVVISYNTLINSYFRESNSLEGN